MSTHCMIIVERAEGGQFVASYCHFDGYPTGVGYQLINHYNDQDLAECLVTGGDMSSLGPRCDRPDGHSYSHPVEGYTVYYGRDRGERNTGPRVGAFDSVGRAHRGIEWYYVWFAKDRWMCACYEDFQDLGTDKLQDLKTYLQDLESLQENSDE